MSSFAIMFSCLALATAVFSKEIYFGDDAIMIEVEELVEVSPAEEDFDTILINESKQEVSEVDVESLRSKRDIETLYVKVLVVIDYSLYRRWVMLQNEDVDQAIQAVRFFYAHLINAIANKFATIDTGPYRYRLTLVGYYIAQTVEASSFTESENVKLPDTTGIKYGAVLQNLVKWVDDNSQVLPKFGVLAGFTTYGDPSAGGMAYVKAACTRMAVSIIQNGLMSSTANVAAHEVGHVLGSAHDGEKNDCDQSSLYLMTPVLNFGKVTNYHTFSSCSRTYFEKYVESLKPSEKEKCFNKESSTEDENVKKYLEEMPGMRFTPDQECQNMMGLKSYYCSPGAQAAKEICYTFMCFHPAKNFCISFPDSKALDGTPCGNKSWCMDKQCVYDERAPEGDGYCMYGESRDPMLFNGVKTYCADVQKSPYLCYNYYIEKLCCKTCLGFKDPENAQCMYGDLNQIMRYGSKRVTCEEFKTDNFYCYVESFRKICCKTCGDIEKQNTPDCPYGDRGISLKQGQEILRCPDFKRYKNLCSKYNQCCKTCAEIEREGK